MIGCFLGCYWKKSRMRWKIDFFFSSVGLMFSLSRNFSIASRSSLLRVSGM